MTLDLAALRETAEAATPGKWKAYVTAFHRVPADKQYVAIGTDELSIAKITGSEGHIEEAMRDARHIAAFDPPTALALLARIEQAEATLQTIVELDKQTELERQREHNRAVEAEAERDRLKAQMDESAQIIEQLKEKVEAAWEERDRLQAQVSAMREALILCADTLEGHLDEPQAVSHGECREAAKAARAALAAQEREATLE